MRNYAAPPTTGGSPSAFVGLWALLMILWAFLTWKNPEARLFVATPVSTAAYLQANAEQLGVATLTTGMEALAGLILAVVASLILFAILTKFPTARALVIPATVVSQVVPLITLAPLFVITLGPGVPSKIVMAGLISFFPLIIALSRSLAETPESIRDFIELYQPRWMFRFRSIYLPLSVPMLMPALRVSATLALVGALVAEMAGAHVGLGKNLFLATRRLEPELLMGSTALVCALGGGYYGLVLLVETVLRIRHYTDPTGR
jgi:NitT/TauT family transport system permease protein